MSNTIVNLTISVVEAEAENVLRHYPAYPYQQAFSTPVLRQKLIAYVLSRLPSLYAALEEQEDLVAEHLHCPPEQQQQIETLIHRGIQYLLSENSSKLELQSSDIHPDIYLDVYEDMEAMNVGSPSAHWFR
jgi:hypothetical protein